MVFSDTVADSPGTGVPRSRKGILQLPVFWLAVVPMLALVLMAVILPRDTSHAAAEPSRDVSGDTWLGGVQYSHVFHRSQTAWEFFNDGQPTTAGYGRMLTGCQAKGGTYITKAGTGTISGTGSGYTTVTLDYSCWDPANG